MSHRKLVLIGAASALSLIGFGLLFATLAASKVSEADNRLHIAMSLLDEGRWDLAGRIARDLQAEGFDCQNSSAWQYVQGVSKLQHVADNLDTPRNRRELHEAAEHLQIASGLGFPIGYTGRGKYYLGWCLYHTYHWEQAAAELDDIDRLWPEKRSEALQMRVEAQLRKTPADLAAAESALSAWQAIPGMSSKEWERIRLSQAQLCLAREQAGQCEQVLQAIRGNSREAFQAMLLRGQWRLKQALAEPRLPAEQRQELLNAAAELARQMKVAADTPPDLRRQATFLSGKILRQQDKLAEALSTFSGARQSSPQSAEAIASGMEEAEILLARGELDEVLATLHYVLRNVDKLVLYNELWMPVAEFRARLLDIGRELRERHEFERAIALAQLMAMAFPESDAIRQQAEALEAWAATLTATLADPAGRIPAAHRQAIADKYQAAGQLFEQLSQLELRSSEYPDILWNAITAYQHAGNLTQANLLLTDYLRHEDRTKRPRGFLALGRNHVNAAQWRKAIDPLERCRVEHPTHPTSFEARLLAAKAHFELNQLDEALELLNENLSGSSTALRPSSDIWRDSLYQLALTLFRQGDELLLGLRFQAPPAASDRESQLQASQAKFMEVVDHLGGFVSRYPEDPRHFEAMYLIARSRRLAAEAPQQIAAGNATIVETARRKLMQQRRLLLEDALNDFSQLRKTIAQHQESLTLSEQTSALLRNCYFGEADTLYELGRWEEAIVAYQNVASRFLNKPESLEALVQMAQCHRKLGQSQIADRILAQAEQVLSRIPPELDAQFVSVTRTSRDGWNDLLGALRKWH